MTDAYAAIQATPIIDTFGNMNLQGRGGQIFSFQIQDPATGQPTDISLNSYTFEIDGYASVPLMQGLTLTTKTLTLPNGLFGIPLNVPVYWVLLDVTGTPTLPLRSGLLTVYGFEAAPP